MPEYIEVTLDTIAEGKLPERFAVEWEKLIENIVDPDRDPGATREITIKIKVLPVKEQDIFNLQIAAQVTTKLAPIKAAMGTGYARVTADGPRSLSRTARDPDLPFGTPAPTNVKEIRGAKSASGE